MTVVLLLTYCCCLEESGGRGAGGEEVVEEGAGAEDLLILVYVSFVGGSFLKLFCILYRHLIYLPIFFISSHAQPRVL